MKLPTLILSLVLALGSGIIALNAQSPSVAVTAAIFSGIFFLTAIGIDTEKEEKLMTYRKEMPADPMALPAVPNGKQNSRTVLFPEPVTLKARKTGNGEKKTLTFKKKLDIEKKRISKLKTK